MTKLIEIWKYDFQEGQKNGGYLIDPDNLQKYVLPVPHPQRYAKLHNLDETAVKPDLFNEDLQKHLVTEATFTNEFALINGFMTYDELKEADAKMYTTVGIKLANGELLISDENLSISAYEITEKHHLLDKWNGQNLSTDGSFHHQYAHKVIDDNKYLIRFYSDSLDVAKFEEARIFTRDELIQHLESIDRNVENTLKEIEALEA